MPSTVYRLRCSCNSYPWGKQGSDSLSARVCANQNGWDGSPDEVFEIVPNKSYAEMWMGTYPVLPSYLADTGEDLQDVIDRNPQEHIGGRVLQKFGHSSLPFLPKALSISRALPLQLHPKKDLASRLHQDDPDTFADPNHKPEIAVALSEFEAFCGFKPLESIEWLMQLDPLRRFLPSDTHKSFTDETLRAVVKTMLQSDDAIILETYAALVELLPRIYREEDSYIPTLAARLAKQYTEADPGILVALITMNYLVLQAGESIYIPAGGIHAYLSGDIVECMARSNNVLNTGFCPSSERSNVELFVSAMTFTPYGPNDCILESTPYDKSKAGKTRLFSPPMSEFDVLQIVLDSDAAETLGGVGGPSILLITKGSGQLNAGGNVHALDEGSVFFVSHNVELQVNANGEEMVMYIMFVE